MKGCPSGGSDSFAWPRGTSNVSGRPRIESRADSRLKAPLSQLCQLESGGQSSCFGVGVYVVAHHVWRSDWKVKDMGRGWYIEGVIGGSFARPAQDGSMLTSRANSPDQSSLPAASPRESYGSCSKQAVAASLAARAKSILTWPAPRPIANNGVSAGWLPLQLGSVGTVVRDPEQSVSGTAKGVTQGEGGGESSDSVGL
uniref:(California timema) hypothetical protein n=1 Tax=Timema californicum TaxID=61474 RepID=A0A7R9J041_TIMCA|nr:unnamed protein product [Timema californicum]